MNNNNNYMYIQVKSQQLYKSALNTYMSFIAVCSTDRVVWNSIVAH